MNTIQNNPYPPASFTAVLAGATPVLSKGETKRILEIAAAEAAFNARRRELSPMALRRAARAKIQTFATGGGEVPDGLDQSEEISKIALAALRSKYITDFDAGPREFLKVIYGKLIARARETLVPVVSRNEAEALAFGVPCLPSPVGRSIERSIGLLEKDLELLNTKDFAFPTGQLLCKKLGLELPRVAAPEAVAA